MFKCNTCGKEFNSKHSLGGHISAHNRGEKYALLRETEISKKRKERSIGPHDCKFLQAPEITTQLHTGSVQYINDKNDGFLYRGMGGKNTNELKQNIKRDGGIQLNTPSSWTTDAETADAFAAAIFIAYPIKKFKKLLSMDYVLDSVTPDQLKALAKINYKGYNLAETYDFYSSESEVISFDNLWIPIENIEINETH